MKLATDVVFTQMSAKEGMKKFGEKAVVTMINSIDR